MNFQDTSRKLKGGNDTLVGGGGKNTFFYGKNDGMDILNSVKETDVVWLYDVNLDDIIAASVANNEISTEFNTGSTVKVNNSSQAQVGVTIVQVNRGWLTNRLKIFNSQLTYLT